VILRVQATTRRFLLALAFVVVSFLGFFGLRVALAAYYLSLNSREGFEKAVRLEPTDPENWYALGRYWQYNFFEPNPARAIEAYETTLKLNPRWAEAWLDLAAAYESQNEIDKARNAYISAARVYPRSADVLWRLGNFLLRQGEVAAGFRAIQEAVQANPKLSGEAIRICRHAEPNINFLVDRVLPPVSDSYLTAIWQLTEDGDSKSGLVPWSRLLALRPIVQQRDLIHFVEGLIRDDQVEAAERVWWEGTALLRPAGPPPTSESVIWDGGFESDMMGGGLAWRIEPRKSILISHDSNVRRFGSRSLRIDIDQKDISGFVGVCQRVIVEPQTEYELSTWIRTKAIPRNGGFFFRIATPQPGSPVFETSMIGGTVDWTELKARWVSPKDYQPVQLCMARSRDYYDEHGTVWVDEVRLTKTGAAR